MATDKFDMGDIDIAWMSPVTHGKFHVQYGRNSQALARCPR